jgi:hypothetical protein
MSHTTLQIAAALRCPPAHRPLVIHPAKPNNLAPSRIYTPVPIRANPPLKQFATALEQLFRKTIHHQIMQGTHKRMRAKTA